MGNDINTEFDSTLNESKMPASGYNSSSDDNLIVIGQNGVIAGLFKNPERVENIYEALLARGYKDEDVTLVMSESTRNTYFPENDVGSSITEIGNKSLEGLGVGAAVGGTIGALAAALAAAGTSLVIPGLGIIVAGSLAASFAGAGAGAAAGGLVGALVGWGIPDEQAKALEDGIKKGGAVIALKTNSKEECENIRKEWLRYSDSNIEN